MSKDCVELGYLEQPVERQELESHYFPSKVGGKPAWLSFKPLPASNILKCSICNQPFCFLLQIYAPDNDKKHAFHRCIFVFVCRNGQCSQTNSSNNFAVFRCQLPRNNEFYLDKPIETDEESAQSKKVCDFSRVCALCGCLADKLCARCKKIAYCDKTHQVMHWKMIHKDQCQQVLNGDAAEKAVNGPTNTNSQCDSQVKNAFLFPEFELVIEEEEFSETDDQVSEKSDSEKMVEYEKFLRESGLEAQNGSAKENCDGLDDLEMKKDKPFKKFMKRVDQNPEQVIRYDKNGSPLWATDYTPENSGQNVPDCDLCGAPRVFEFQIMPHLLSYLNVDDVGKSLDWATVAVYTCSTSCTIESLGYAKEFVWKQDFLE